MAKLLAVLLLVLSIALIGGAVVAFKYDSQRVAGLCCVAGIVCFFLSLWRFLSARQKAKSKERKGVAIRRQPAAAPAAAPAPTLRRKQAAPRAPVPTAPVAPHA